VRRIFTVPALIVLLGAIPLALVAVLLYRYVWSAEVAGTPVVAVVMLATYITATFPWLLHDDEP
jgi:hypothetical protein